MSLLSVRGLTKRFGGLLANDTISFEVPEGMLLAVIGPNGAGKTTLFNIISGALAPSSGTVWFDGRDISALSAAQTALLGVIRTYQLVQLFKDLTVEENVLVGSHRIARGGIAAALFRPRWVREQEERLRDQARELLAFVGLGQMGEVVADRLPYGQQRLLEIARALAAKPRLLLLDEPAAGLNIEETAALADIIVRINRGGTTVLLIEHDMSLIMKIASRIVVLDFGRVIAEGTADDIRKHPDVIAAYLGDETMADLV
jgi:branched-chain amino acid transport system ATP-binding protein